MKNDAAAAAVQVGVTIRRAREHEAELLSSIATQSKAHWPYSDAQIAAWRDGLTIFADDVLSFPTYVAEIESQVAGFFLLKPSVPHWQLEHLWILSPAMGRGIGRALLAQAVSIAIEGGASGIAIDSDPYAEPFYLACGAIRVGAVAAPIEGAQARERPQLLLTVAVETGTKHG